MATTVQISEDLLKVLKNRKMFEHESYEDVILDLLEDSMELSEETLKNIEKSKKDIEVRRMYTIEEVKRKLKLWVFIMYKIVFSDTAFRKFKKLEKNTQNRITSVLERIKIRPTYFLKKLVGLPYFRLRVGDYRILIDVDFKNKILYILEVGHRKNIYKF